MLHFLNPIKRNARFIKAHGMLKFKGKLPGYEGVVYKKASVNGEGWQLIRVNPSVVKMLTALGLDPSTDAGMPENAEIKS